MHDNNSGYDEIIVKGLKVFAYHGVFQEEKREGQNFVLDLVVELPLERAATSDRLDDTVNYDQICAVVRDAMTAQSYDLIERAAGAVIQAVFDEFPAVMAVTVTVKKPEAPLCCEVDYAGVRLRRVRPV